MRFGVGQVGPVIAPALQWEGQGGGHLGAEIQAVIRAAGFQQQHADAFVFGQAGGQHVTGRAGADDDVVEFLGHKSSCSPDALRGKRGDCSRIASGLRGDDSIRGRGRAAFRFSRERCRG